MVLSKRASDALERAFTDRDSSDEIKAALESGANAQATNVADLGALDPVGSVDVADAGPADVALAADVDARLAQLQAKLDAALDALKASGLMAAD